MSRPILILGPHRSGTSALTRVVNLLGVDLGGDMLPPRSDNARGYWEHREAFDLNERLLAVIGSAWHDVLPLPRGWRAMEEVEALADEIRSFLNAGFGDSPLWGVKDPRLCRLLPVWLDAIHGLATAPGFLILVRNPLEVATSLARRNDFSFDKGLLLYLSEMLAAIRHTEGHPRAFVSYAMLLESWPEVVERIAHELDLDWPNPPAERRGEIEAFLRPGDRHHRFDLDALHRHPALPPWSTDLYAALEAACAGRTEALETAFPEAWRAYREGTALFGPEMRHLQDRVVRLEARLEAAEQRDAAVELEHLERRADVAERELAKVQEHLTGVLSSPLYRSTRMLRRAWAGLGRLRRSLGR